MRVLVDTVGVEDIKEMVGRSLDAIELAAEEATPHGGRTLPLITMPILGVGQGSFNGRRAEVVRELITRLSEFAANSPIDVVLILRRTSDFAAAQWARSLAGGNDRDLWPALAPDLRKLADRLGEMAARGELSIFVGAGVSQPVGLPGWKRLLQELSPHRVLEFTKDTDYSALAQSLNRPNLNIEVARKLTTTKHALGHALLVDLRTPLLVTTNYDPCLENAAELIHTKHPLQVMARQIAVGGSPWLLKLHGDVARPETIVLTTDQYKALENEYSALRGVVQALMLTSHLLFVGFGFDDNDFLKMSEAVQQVRKLATKPLEDAKVGTAIELCQSKDHKYTELDYRHMRIDDDRSAAARELEIFLDRLVWRCQVAGHGRASYLLDPDYQQDATAADRALVEALKTLRDNESNWRESSGAQAVRDLMDELGWRSFDDSQKRSLHR